MIQADYNHIIETLYEDVLSDAGFSGALRAFQGVFGIEQTWLVTWNRPNDLIRVDGTAGIIPEFQAAYEAHYQFTDPAKENFTDIAVGDWWVDSQQMGMARMKSSAFHQDFLRSYDMASYMGSPILRSSEQEVALSFLKSRRQRLFTDADTHAIDVIIPHLRNAFRVREQMMELATTASLSMQLLERLSFGVAVIDDRLRIVLHNRSGEQWLRCLGPKWRWAHRHPGLGQAFQDLIRVACRLGAPTPTRATILADSERSSCLMVVLPLPAAHRFSVAWQRPAALVMFYEPGRVSKVLARVLRDIYGLSASEARLAMKLAGGRRLHEVGAELGITHETARSALKKVFLKTGTKSQSQLVRILTLLSTADEPHDFQSDP
jgi:DNA-binding CsgD family transcriptional regulator